MVCHCQSPKTHWKGFLGISSVGFQTIAWFGIEYHSCNGWIFRMLRYVEQLVKPYPTDISTDLLSSSSRLSSYSFSIVQFSAPFFLLKHLYFNLTVTLFRGIPIKKLMAFSPALSKAYRWIEMKLLDGFCLNMTLAFPKIFNLPMTSKDEKDLVLPLS